MSTRNTLLNRLRKVVPIDSGRDTPASTHVSPANALPTDTQSLLALFVQRAEESGARVIKVRKADFTGLTQALDGFSPISIPEPSLCAQHIALNPETGDNPCRTTLVRAHAALAETGSVCLDDSEVPTKFYFLCDQLLVLLKQDSILGCQEDYWRSRRPPVPRAVHVVTGPSRTADVEQTLQIGAHGPKSVTIFLEINR